MEAPDFRPEFDPAQLQAGERLFARQVDFVLGVTKLEDLPPDDLPEVAFAGRSNVGKSSLLNAVTGRKRLARTSGDPGRTRELNFFNANGECFLVDLPGYGYARAPKTEVKRWTALTRDYLRGRPALKRVFLLIDSRHGIKTIDAAIMDVLDEAAVSYQVVLTKTDKLKGAESDKRMAETSAKIAKRPAAHPVIHSTSSTKTTGLGPLRAEIAALATQ